MDNGAGPSNAASTNELFVYIKSQKGKDVLLHAGHRYNFKTLNKKSGSTNWRCSNRDACSASITIDKEKSAVLYSSAHTCRTNFNKNRVDSAIDECKKQACRKYTSIQKIFEKEFSRECNSDIENIPAFVSKKDTLYRARRIFKKIQNRNLKTLMKWRYLIFWLTNFWCVLTEKMPIKFCYLPPQWVFNK